MPALRSLRHEDVLVRPIRVADWRALQRELAENRSWLFRWEASNPDAQGPRDVRSSVRQMVAATRAGEGIAYAIEFAGQFAGQLTVAQLTYGSLRSCSVGYWVARRFAGRNVVPTAVALVVDDLFQQRGIHRVEICMRPENLPSRRVVQKLGFRYEGLRRRYIHINGDWRDHFCFALVAEEVPEGVLERWLMGKAPQRAAVIPQSDLDAATATELS